MSSKLPFPQLEDPIQLAGYHGWDEGVYVDLLALQRGELTRVEFDAKYIREQAILVLDLTGFTQTTMTTMTSGAVSGFLRILNAHKTCLPVVEEFGSHFIRTFADDIVALFDDPGAALDAAREIHERTRVRAELMTDGVPEAECSIGIGFGRVYTIGPNRAMGDEMNRASKLGEDTARGGETLVTENAREQLMHREDLDFRPLEHRDLPFPYYSVTFPA